jgi:hypothetical protein
MVSDGPGIGAPLYGGPGWDAGAGAALAEDPFPREGFHAGKYHRLRVGGYRIVYIVEADLITISRVDRVLP